MGFLKMAPFRSFSPERRLVGQRLAVPAPFLAIWVPLMTIKTPHHTAAFTQEGDLILVGGSADPALLFPRQSLAGFLRHPVSSPPIKITSLLGNALIQVAAVANATFSLSPRRRPPGTKPDDIILIMTFDRGFKAAFDGTDTLLWHKGWFFRRKIGIIAGTHDFVFSHAESDLIVSFVNRYAEKLARRRKTTSSHLDPCGAEVAASVKLALKRRNNSKL
jgi:hypothetical protein